ncbi:ribonuclease P protein component [Lysobacter solisilvae (ex Woo and Kim 2020)]|uniref:Ribonuclease P protein component n=1 Tax=Agrilutibacter terrestris TaxID=2865112 RepID=A0A7H0G112_9GAMM|nr:ribonuclease P protein component [Lysobacter terrestris]QNP41978.1 ribonuclease P protein component [Lysobacter terrestris]
MNPVTSRFPRTARVRARADFDRIFEHGRRQATPRLAVHWHATDTPARLGLAVSRKVDPRAVGRNRIKRSLRDVFRRHRTALAAGDYVVVARATARAATHEQLERHFLDLLRRLGALPVVALPLTPAPGTMPPAPDALAPSAPATGAGLASNGPDPTSP